MRCGKEAFSVFQLSDLFFAPLFFVVNVGLKVMLHVIYPGNIYQLKDLESKTTFAGSAPLEGRISKVALGYIGSPLCVL